MLTVGAWVLLAVVASLWLGIGALVYRRARRLVPIEARVELDEAAPVAVVLWPAVLLILWVCSDEREAV